MSRWVDLGAKLRSRLVDRDDLSALMYDARGCYRSVRATVREWHEAKTVNEMRERFRRSRAYLETADSRDAVQESDNSWLESADYERIWQVWHEKPDRWRQEIEQPGKSGTEYRVVDGAATWIYSLDTGPHAATGGFFGPEFEIAYLFEPRRISSELKEMEWQTIERTQHAGREAIRVQAVKHGEWGYPPEPLWWGADDYEFVVDAERGLILLLASRLGGRVFDITEVLDISFDEVFSDDAFVLSLPGVRFDRVDYLKEDPL